MQAIRIIDVPDPVESVAPDAPPALRYADIIPAFLLAGHAHFVVVNPKGERMPFIIRARAGRKGTEWADETSYFLSVFSGGRYQYVGVVHPNTGDIKPTGRSAFLRGTREYDVGQWAITSVFEGHPIAAGYTITHNGKCGKCARSLVEMGDRQSGFHLDCT